MWISLWTTEISWVALWATQINQITLWTNIVFSWYTPVSKSFSYTWSDQSWTVPYTQYYKITCKWAGSNTSAWWLWSWILKLTKGTVLKIMVWQSWSTTSSWTYWFGWTSNYSSNRSWWWLSWVFTWDSAITATDSARALVIWGWAWGWQSSSRPWWVWGGTTWATWWWSNYGTAWWGWTQTGRWSGWNTWSEQFRWWNWSWTYWWWWWGWWRWWNGSIWDWSWDDDKWAGWGSGYVISTATSPVLTQWWWAASQNNWSVTIESIDM